jgi:hypothetical protein
MKSIEAVTIYKDADRATVKRLTAGWSAEAAFALGAVVLSVIGLASTHFETFAALAAICLGGAVLLEGAALASCWIKFPEERWQEGQRLEWGGGIIGKLVAGIVGIIVGILVLIGTVPPTLLSLATLVFGAAFLFTSMVSIVPGTQELAGAGAFVLGLLAVIGLHSFTFVLVALLGLAIIAILNGVASERSMLSERHQHDVRHATA